MHLHGRKAALVVARASLRRLSIERGEAALGVQEAASAASGADLAVACLPAAAAMFRILEFPFGDRRRLDYAVGPALEEHLPVSLDDGVVAYDLLNATAPYRVLAALVPEQVLAEHRKALAEIGLAATRAAWAPTAAAATYASAVGPSDCVIVHRDIDSITVAAFEAGRLAGLRIHLPTEGSRLARNVAWSVRTLDPRSRRLVVGGVDRASLRAELASSLDDFELAEPAEAGAVAGLEPDLDWSVVATPLGAVLAAAGTAPHTALWFPLAPQPTPVAGGAPASWRSLAAWAGACALCLAVAAGLDAARVAKRCHALEKAADQIVARVLPAAAGKPGRRLKLEMRLAELERRAATGGAGPSAVATLAAISKAVPKQVKVEFDTYLYDPPEVRIRGHAGDFEDVTKLEQALEGAPEIASVQANSVRAAVSGEGVDFDITVRLEEPSS